MSCRSWWPSAAGTGMVLVPSTAPLTARCGHPYRVHSNRGVRPYQGAGPKHPWIARLGDLAIEHLSNGFQCRGVASAPSSWANLPGEADCRSSPWPITIRSEEQSGAGTKRARCSPRRSLRRRESREYPPLATVAESATLVARVSVVALESDDDRVAFKLTMKQ